MKQTRYHISLYIIIPFITAGIACFSALVAFRFTEGYLSQGNFSEWAFSFLAVIIAFVAFFCGLVVVRSVLKPVEMFVERAEQLPQVVKTNVETREQKHEDELGRFTRVSAQVTDFLTKIDAQQLFPEVVAVSRAMRGILSQAMKVASTDSTVLISGESGTGKELVASSIFEFSPRRDKPFVKINCVAIPEGLLESELFGHEKGAFTGATSQKKGKFEIADGGTLFLDEIGDMPLNTQAKMLRVLQEMEFERVGGAKPIKVDVRLIAATNKNLERMVKNGQFRKDLYFRLNVFCMNLPPLRERKEDIPSLVSHFLARAPGSIRISSTALQSLLTYSWPGNVRELQNVIESATVMCENELIETQHLPDSTSLDITGHAIPSSQDEVISIDRRLADFEKMLVIDALKRTRGVQVRAAELLGINERSLYHRIKKHGVDVKSLKNN
ncbi:MAG: sigma-54 dependent transcriptional regulator [Thermodesulfobacteriota bacterium]|nr:sigma-54 dependent transcriptional regulator [Thermodesulfobacteriota bacterium]